MDGGCIDIWRELILNEFDKRILLEYSRYINKFSKAFSIRFRTLTLKSCYERAQVYNAIGYLPKQEILVCGFANVIFL